MDADPDERLIQPPQLLDRFVRLGEKLFNHARFATELAKAFL
jgi:hypothetical protein